MQPFASPQRNGHDADDRRQHARYKRLVKAFISDAAAKAEPITAWVSDCSLGGLGLEVHQEFKPGMILTLRPANAGPDFRWLKVEVKSCRPGAGEGTWELGCQFLRTPSYSVLLMFR